MPMRMLMKEINKDDWEVDISVFPRLLSKRNYSVNHVLSPPCPMPVGIK